MMRSVAVTLVFLGLTATGTATARADAPGYAWRSGPASADTLATRFPPPAGATRIPLAAGSFGDWLRHLPLVASPGPLLLYDGTPKARQDVHAAIVDLDVGTRDLQQCADAVMRLRAEYLFAAHRPVAFHPEPGKPRVLEFTSGDRRAFAKYLVRVFADAGTASLAAELPSPPASAPIEPGDVLIQGGYPGHAVLVLDVAQTPDGKRRVLIGQSYMPAQQFHVVKNFADPSLSPWFDARALDAGLRTPEWRPFTRRDLRRFR
jgi:hypothetical protein